MSVCVSGLVGVPYTGVGDETIGPLGGFRVSLGQLPPSPGSRGSKIGSMVSTVKRVPFAKITGCPAPEIGDYARQKAWTLQLV